MTDWFLRLAGRWAGVRLGLLILVCLAHDVRAADTPRLQLEKGERVCLIGNTLADRMQHDGWLETYVQARYPQHELAFRNLGFSGDELTLRLRSADFGSPDEWLTRCEADVVWAMFGYGESFAGDEGLAKFREDLTEFVRHTLGQQYNGQSPPRLVLFTPLAHEDLESRLLPDGQANNARLEKYAQAMVEVAAEEGVPVVDLFSISRKLQAESDEPLTINGIHCNEHGNRLLGAAIDRALFGAAGDHDAGRLRHIRQAVVDRNAIWFQRYRTTDGYSIYGGRADLKFVNDQTNREVMQREMEVLDVMTANRDRAVWAAAQGQEPAVDDSNTPEFIEVISNKPGPLPGGQHVFLPGEQAIERMTVHDNMQVNLFASEEQFPELVNPVQMAWDNQGRLWVAAWQTYPHWKPKEPMNDKLLILEDTDGDGRADRCTTFVDDLHNPTGFEFWNGGVLVAMVPDLLFLKDTDGDDRPDVRQRVVNGLDSADTHHAANSFTFDPGGALYFQEGTFHHTQVESPWGPTRRLANAGVFRYEPRTQKFDIYVSYGFANPHGHVFDRWGQDVVIDGTGAQPFHGALFSGRIDFPIKHAKPPQVYQQRTRPCSGLEILSSGHFPDDMQGNLLVPNVIGFQGILRYKLEGRGSSFGATEQEPILSSDDPNFRPSDLEIGPDGALYFADWHNPIIGHMQHNLRDPHRNRVHGRIYRVTYADRPLLERPPIAGQPIPQLLELLKQPEDRVRYAARLELSARDSDEVLAATQNWLASLDAMHADHEHHVLEALWVYQQHDVVNSALLERILSAEDFRARAAGARVLWAWRDRISASLDLFKRLAADEHPRVRLEAVRAASYYDRPEAVEVVAVASELPTDEYLDFVKAETMRTLGPIWQRAVSDGSELTLTTDAGRRYLLESVSNEQLVNAPRTRLVLEEMLDRPGLQDEHRRAAIRGLAELDGRTELQVIIEAIQSLDQRSDSVDTSVVFDLVRQLASRPADELAAARAELESITFTARQPIFRQIGFVTLASIDGSVDPAWQLALRSAQSLRDFALAIPLFSDAVQQASLYSRIEPLLHELPPELASAEQEQVGPRGRFVRIELPRRGTLTLAEVEVYSGGRNVAPQGRASQKNTSHGGDAAHAIDGNTSGRYGDGGQTHTRERTDSPWWEVDLGASLPIEAITIHNRTEGDLGKRLDGFNLLVFDEQRGEVYRQENLPAPTKNARFALGAGDPESIVRRAAMQALISMRGHEADTFRAIAPFVQQDQDRDAAIAALRQIPQALWPAEEAGPLVDTLLARLRQTPPADRTSEASLDMQELAYGLANVLPADRAREVRGELNELGIRVVRVGTLFERMSFDQDVLAVQAGRPMEFVFENTDLMPHNFVVVQPGTLEEIGLQAEATAQDASAAERQFVPQSPHVLLASRLLQPRESQRLSFTPPTEPGVYPYVCTYPGHWRRMYGALYVVDDFDAYQADPAAYLASHPLEIKDTLLKDRRPRTEWTMELLAEGLTDLHGRSHATGKQLFQVSSCTACHKLDDVGVVFGPDLTKLDPKWQAADVLRHLLEPSEKIDDKFRSYTFVLASGRVLTGMIVEETPDEIQVIENPLAKAEPTVLAVSEIDEREPLPISIMPKGLLDKLNREEVLDLIAYLLAHGQPDHPIYQAPAHGHGHAH